MLKRRLISGLLAASAVALVPMASVATAGEKAPKKYHPPFGMAGCGLWTYVIKDKDRGAQLAVWALRSFIFPDFQPFGITSGTSNCRNTHPENVAQEQQVFIAANLNSLTKEAAQGDGEHLTALAEVFGCPHPEFAKLSQTHYADIYENAEADMVLRNYLRAVEGDKDLAQRCERATLASA